MRDLLGLEVDASTLLPADDASHGFDNITVGELSPTLLDRYLAAARKISRLAVGVPVKSPGGDVRVAATGASQNGVMRVSALEAALKANWSAAALDNVKVSADGFG